MCINLHVVSVKPLLIKAYSMWAKPCEILVLIDANLCSFDGYTAEITAITVDI